VRALRAVRTVMMVGVLAAVGGVVAADPAFAVCGDGVFDPGESCDDGNIASEDGCSGSCRLEPRDHYKCYRIKQVENGSRGARIGVADRFGSADTSVGKPVMFCAPADTNGDGITDRSTHLTCYEAKGNGERASRRERTVLVGNLFGGRKLMARKPRTLCVPSVPVSGILPVLIPCGDGALDDGEECDDGNTAGGDGCSAGCRIEPEQRYRCHDATVLRSGPKFDRTDVTLADGFESTSMMAVKPVQICAPADASGQGVADPGAHLECFKLRPVEGASRTKVNREVEVLNEFGTERFTVVDGRTLCLASGEPVSLQPPSIDSFKCYTAKTKLRTTKFATRTVDLMDDIESKETKVTSPAQICTPASVDGKALGDPTTNLACYNVATVQGQGKFRARDVVVNNRFGTQTLTLTKAKALCTPAEVPPVPSVGGIDHFKCYVAKAKKGSPEFKKHRITVADLFETKNTRVRAPSMFCNAVSQDGQAIADPAAQITCYTIEDRAGQPPFTRRDTQITDQFGDAIWNVTASKTLCVPSVKVFTTSS
jgi:cysteine-rich repeat protein